jgi:hypothetical protein
LYLVLFAAFFLQSSDASCQAALQNSQQQDTSRKSILKLKDNSGIPWEPVQKSPLFLDNPSNIKSSVIYNAEKNEYVVYQ